MSFEHKNFSTRIYTPKKGKNFVEVEGMEPQGQSKETIFAPELSVHREKPAASKKKKIPKHQKKLKNSDGREEQYPSSLTQQGKKSSETQESQR